MDLIFNKFLQSIEQQQFAWIFVSSVVNIIFIIQDYTFSYNEQHNKIFFMV